MPDSDTPPAVTEIKVRENGLYRVQGAVSPDRRAAHSRDGATRVVVRGVVAGVAPVCAARVGEVPTFATGAGRLSKRPASYRTADRLRGAA